jgi:UDP-glucose 4-epimerase
VWAVLVTGESGAIGSWVTRELVEQGRRAVSYDARLDTTLVKDIEDKLECVVGDILDLPSIIHTIKRYEVERIIHMAAALPDLCEANPLVGFRINVEGTLNVFEAARLMDIRRVVYASSRSVYDISRGEYAHPTYKPIDEDYPKAPRDVYGATKLFAEHMGVNYNRIYGLDVIGLRFA